MPRSLHSLSLLVFALLACNPDKQSSTDASTGSSTTSGTSQPVNTGSTTTPDAPTTSSSTSTDPATDTGATSTTGTTSTDDPSTSTTSTTGAPAGECSEQMNQADCEALLGRSGHPGCGWIEEFAQWSEEAGCGTFVGPPRCVEGSYAGDGCFGGCADAEFLYVREIAGGVFELMEWTGYCGVEPVGWQACDTSDRAPLACSCFC